MSFDTYLKRFKLVTFSWIVLMNCFLDDKWALKNSGKWTSSSDVVISFFLGWLTNLDLIIWLTPWEWQPFMDCWKLLAVFCILLSLLIRNTCNLVGGSFIKYVYQLFLMINWPPLPCHTTSHVQVCATWSTKVCMDWHPTSCPKKV